MTFRLLSQLSDFDYNFAVSLTALAFMSRDLLKSL
tara:strand:+ start:3159 stop:3263 length:105 start_codon:yes stop_codon:yes gene_type:complete